ncbi:replicative DNA helicase [Brooklawnia cerclae]|uniref:DNA 5'-3' helicase n=1 Tax=Brooklawnia cerclae TaxID=349934 RepID=A0ABX0SJ89_9ACTN|nr:replicative DNA helicase [Brooklawnia cerclae]NIH58487.1 replicative DNA helicase [Brooklawnia cerclae]
MTVPAALDRPAPYDPDAEKAILGAAMIDPRVIDELTGIITPDDLYQPAHEQTWRVLVARHETGQVIDPITVADVLPADTLAALGGSTGLADCVSAVTVVANAPAWAEIVHEKAVRRRTADAATRIQQMALQGSLGPSELVDEAQRTLDRIDPAVRHTTATAADGLEALVDAIGAPQAAGIPTPWAKLNDLIGGLRPGRLYIVGGRPAEGKSLIGQNLAEHAARHGERVLLSTVEMTADEIRTRMLAHASGVNLATISGTHQSETDWRQINTGVARMLTYADRIHIDDSPAQTVTTIKATARDLQRRGGLGLLVVDYLQLLTPLGGRASSRSREQEVAEMSRILKLTAKDLAVPVVALSQLNRALVSRSDKKPTMSDLRESGAIEQDADVVMLMHHPDPRDDPSRLDLLVEKNRAGRRGALTLLQRGWVAAIDTPANPWETRGEAGDDEQEGQPS